MEKCDNLQRLTEFESLVYDSVCSRQIMKREDGQVPDYVMFDEICNGLRAEALEVLRSLYRKGLIEHHQTVNGIPMFGIKQNENG